MRRESRSCFNCEKRDGGPDGIVLELTRKGGDGFYDVIYTMDVILGDPGKSYPMLVDTGSSDMWVASSGCGSCRSAPAVYDPAASSTSIQTSQTFSYNYLAGSVLGSIYWEQVTIGTYTVLHQAIVAATNVANEALDMGFSGIIGLALPPLSNVSTILGIGSGGGGQDGATIFSNLFGLPSPQGPSHQFFSILLSRPGFDSRDKSANAWPSRMGIGAHVDEVVHAFSDDGFENKIQWATMTSTSLGYTHWKTRMTSVTVFKDGAVLDVQLPRGGDGGMQPIAALDTGGSIMLASKKICDAIYGSWGVSISEDGKYYVPCKQPLNMTISLSTGSPIPIHPLDMSSYINNDRASNPVTCIGSLQANELLGNRNSPADIVLGVPFLRNVYTIHSLGRSTDSGQTGTSTDDDSVPRIGLLPITDSSLALHEFQNVRELGLAPDGGRDQNNRDPEDTKRSMGVLGKIMLGVGLFAALCVLLFGVRWIVLSKRFKSKKRNGLASEEGFQMREWAETIKRRVTRRGPDTSEFGVPENIAGDVATPSALGHGSIRRRLTTKSTKRQGSGPFAGFSFLTFIGGRRLGFGGGYRRTSNPVEVPDRQPTEDEVRQQKFEEYKRKRMEEEEWGRRNRTNETSVWSDVTWIDNGNGTLTPVGATSGLVPLTPNETVVGSTTNLNAYGFPKIASLDDLGRGKHQGNLDDGSDNESTERGSTLHGSPLLDGKLGTGITNVRRTSKTGLRDPEHESSSLIPLNMGNLAPGRLADTSHRSIPSLELNRPIREDSIPVTASPYPITPGAQPVQQTSFNPYDIPTTIPTSSIAPIPDYSHRGRPPLAMEPTLSPLTEVNSSELPPSTSGDYNAAARQQGEAALISGPFIDSSNLAETTLNPREGLDRQGSVGSLGSMSISSEVLVPLPISLMTLPPSLYSSTSADYPSSSVIRISDSPPPQPKNQVITSSEPEILLAPAPTQTAPRHQHTPGQNFTSLSLQPPTEVAQPQSFDSSKPRNQNPFDPYGIDSFGRNESRFPVFAPSSSQATPRQTNNGEPQISTSRPASMANLPTRATPRVVTSGPMLPRPYSEIDTSSSITFDRNKSGATSGLRPPHSTNIPILNRENYVSQRVDNGGPPTSMQDFAPQIDLMPGRMHHTLPMPYAPSRPAPSSRLSDPVVSSLGLKSRGPRPMVRGSTSNNVHPTMEHDGRPFGEHEHLRQNDSPISFGSPSSGTPDSARQGAVSRESVEWSSPHGARGPRPPASRSSQESNHSRNVVARRERDSTSPPQAPLYYPQYAPVDSERNPEIESQDRGGKVEASTGTMQQHSTSSWREEAAHTAGMAGVGARSRFTGDTFPTITDPTIDRQ